MIDDKTADFLKIILYMTKNIKNKKNECSEV